MIKFIFIILTLTQLINSKNDYERIFDITGSFIPTSYLNITLGNKQISFGNRFSPNETRIAPERVLFNSDSGLHTLIFIDPDAPSRENPIRRNILHWIIINMRTSQINTGRRLISYTGSAPPAATGDHRYIFLIYKQRHIIEHSQISQRAGWNLTRFVGDFSLNKPIAANWYIARNEG